MSLLPPKKKSKNAVVGREVLNVLIQNNAFAEDSAIKLAKFKDLPFSSETIAYTIGNFYQEGIIKIVGNDRYYYDQATYNRYKKRKTILWYVMIGLPILVFMLYLFISGDFSRVFG